MSAAVPGAARRAAMLLLGAAALTGCGAGSDSSGGQDLAVDISYSGISVDLFTPLRLLPTILGLGSNTPHCRISSGSLPPGVTVEDGCDLVGTPSAPGAFSATVSLSVAGISGSVSVLVRADIRVPALAPVRSTATQPPDQVVAAGSSLNGFAIVTLQDFTPRSGVSVRYALAAGALPPGLALNPVDGSLSGVAAVPGRWTFSLLATISQGALVYSTAAQAVVLDVR